MIVGVCADKGSPGATTFAVALGMVWPGQRLVMEADPSGGDLAFWARHGSGKGLLAAQPSVLTVAADARAGLAPAVLAGYGQPTEWGVDVVPGAPGSAGYTPMRALWPGVAAEATRWPGTVIADLGRIQAGHPAMAVAQSAAPLLVLTRVSVEALFHLRERVAELTRLVGDPAQARTSVVVVVRARKKHAQAEVAQVTRMLAAVGPPVLVAGAFLDDEAGAAELRAGQPGRHLRGGDLLASANRIGVALRAWWQHLEPTPVPSPPRVLR